MNPLTLTSEMIDSILRVALEAADTAATMLRERMNDADKVVDAAGAHDIKLRLDKESEATIERMIRATFPDHSILSEESGLAETGAPFVWHNDPIDGTVNFYYGLPYWCVSVACYANPGRLADPREFADLGEPVAGVIVCPRLDETFVAATGRGATLNGRPIRVRDVQSLDQAIVGTALGNVPQVQRKMTGRLEQLLPAARKTRVLGATAVDLAYIAAGRLSAMCQYSIHTHDIAAAYLILREAGGDADFIRTDHPHGWDMIASVPGIRDALRETIYPMNDTK